MISIPVRHGKTELINLYITWLLICRPDLRIARIMHDLDTARHQSRLVLKYLERWGPVLTGTQIDKRRYAADHFETTAGGMVKSIGMGGNVDSWTFDVIICDDLLVTPEEIRNPNVRDHCYQDITTKFFSRINPMGTTKFLFIGSRRHPDDPQGRLLIDDRKVTDSKEKWHYHMRPAIYNDGIPDKEYCPGPDARA